MYPATEFGVLSLLGRKNSGTSGVGAIFLKLLVYLLLASCNNTKSFEHQPVLFSLLSVGNFIPISQVREDVASAYRKEEEWRASNMLVPFQKMCAQRKVRIILHNCLIVPPAVSLLFSEPFELMADEP